MDYHLINPHAFVYSVPFDVGKKKTAVTASHAIMVGKGNQKAPAAVAGMQIGKLFWLQAKIWIIGFFMQYLTIFEEFGMITP